MKRFISILLLITLCLSSVPAFALGADGFPEFGAEVNIGRVNWSAETHNGTICYDREGNPLMCYATQGGFFWVIDLMTGHVKQKFNTTGTYIMAHLVTTAPDGKVYNHYYPGNVFDVYDPIAGTYEALPTEPSHHSQDGGCITDDGIVYLGEYIEDELPEERKKDGAMIFEYNINTKETRLYSTKDGGNPYIKGVCADDKYVYAGGGGGTKVCMYRIDKETGDVTEFLINPGGGIIYTAYLLNGKIVANTNGALHIVNRETLEKEITIPTSHNRQGELEDYPVDPNLLYHCRKGAIWRYNFATQEHVKVADTTLGVSLAWAELPNGDWVLSLRSATMEKVGYFNPRTGEVVELELDQIADAGPNGQTLEISPQGILYRGGYQSSQGAYNINTGDFIYSMPKWTQNEGIGFLNGKTYFGTYTDAVIYRYDPERPLTDDYLSYNYDTKYRGYDANPGMVWDIEDGQDRTFVLKGYKDKLYIGSFSGYNEVGGALAILSEEDGVNPPKTELYRNVIPNQSIAGLAFKDNLVYIGSTARNGKGVMEFVEDDAEIAVFDLDKKEVVERFKPDIPGIGTSAKTYGELSFGPDGLLYGAVADKEGIVFALDPETHEVVKSVTMNSGFDRGAMARPAYLRWGDDGLLYTTCGWNVYVINPSTMQYKKLVSSCSLMTLDHNGNLWTGRGAFVFYRKINQYDRLTGFLKILDTYLKKEDYTEDEWAELQKEIDKARKYTEETDWTQIQDSIRIIKGLRDKDPYIEPQNDIDIIFNGEKLDYDYDTTGTIKIYNGTTYVPYRAFLEMLGYKATWNVHNATITAEKEGSSISMVLHKNNTVINGEKVETDICPMLLSGRQYIPVRLISEKLGYEVIWNEKENKVYIDKK